MLFLMILGASLLGIIGHWVTRWAQGRTQSTFFEYLATHRARTISSFFSTFASAGFLYQTATPDVSGNHLVLLLVTAYTTSYTLDSKVNRDQDQEQHKDRVVVRGESRTIEEFIKDDQNKSLNAILDDDANT